MFEIVGQEFSKRMFEDIYNNNSVSHAYLLAGPDGTGKSIFAMNMATKLLCEGRDKPCGVCPSCIKIKSRNHPDLVILKPNGRSIGVDEIRDLTEEIYRKPYEGNKKVVIIKESESITVQGQNALLKTLEEPSIYTTIIMLTKNENAILPTIRSRGQIIRLGRVSLEKIKNYLITKGIDPQRAEMAANLSDGIVGNAEKAISNDFLSIRSEAIKMAKNITACSELDLFKDINFFIENKNNIEEILDIFLAWFRDIMLIKLLRDKEKLINSDYYPELVEESHRLSYNRLDRIIKVIIDTRDKLHQNANFQLTMEVMLLKIQEV